MWNLHFCNSDLRTKNDFITLFATDIYIGYGFLGFFFCVASLLDSLLHLSLQLARISIQLLFGIQETCVLQKDEKHDLDP